MITKGSDDLNNKLCILCCIYTHRFLLFEFTNVSKVKTILKLESDYYSTFTFSN